MIIDAHVHCSGRERTDDVLRTFDDAEVDVAVLLAPFLSPGYSMHDYASLDRANQHLAELVRGHADRLVGFAVLNPKMPEARQRLRHAVETLGLRGLKMVPSGWYPYDEVVLPLYEEAASLRIPILFHSGIFIDGKSSRYCRPSFYEAVRDYPGLKVTLAHLGWPWTDESNAVGLIDLINGVPPDEAPIRFDISFGAPPVYRREVMERALGVLGPGLLQFGSDCFLPCPGEQVLERKRWVDDLFNELRVSDADRSRMFSGTAAAWLGLAEKTTNG